MGMALQCVHLPVASQASVSNREPVDTHLAGSSPRASGYGWTDVCHGAQGFVLQMSSSVMLWLVAQGPHFIACCSIVYNLFHNHHLLDPATNLGGEQGRNSRAGHN
jgi:hypothetical protein